MSAALELIEAFDDVNVAFGKAVEPTPARRLSGGFGPSPKAAPAQGKGGGSSGTFSFPKPAGFGRAKLGGFGGLGGGAGFGASKASGGFSGGG